MSSKESFKKQMEKYELFLQKEEDYETVQCLLRDIAKNKEEKRLKDEVENQLLLINMQTNPNQIATFPENTIPNSKKVLARIFPYKFISPWKKVSKTKPKR